ncbi:ABC transporter permease [Acinetobacter sp. ANC 3882]|uniref:ABC transporter permease n=1 Tax=Acinetobacter sp. ANC 3882 TaxID=2923423 RepID=UPI001F4A9A8B|nr:ABC transporter permease [Acinetobacter sp. ANC 3882]MCH7315954.1 ABC transporter permease [Acinetobacter sp. ANC 3882]
MSSIETQLENEHTWQRINLSPCFKQIGIWAVRILLALVLPGIALAVWHYAFQKQWLPEQILPSPALVWQTTLELIDTHELQDNLWISLKRVAWSVLVGGSIGLLLGFLIGLSRLAHKFIYPTFNLIAQFPVIGWIPLLMIFLGIDESLKIAAISLAVFVPVLVATYRSVLNVPPHLLEVSQVYRFSAWQRFRRVILPSALPNIVSGLRQGIMQAWLSLVFVELLASSEGIGYLIVWGRQLIQPDIIFMAVIVIGIVGFVLDHILGWVERWFSHWQRSAF